MQSCKSSAKKCIGQVQDGVQVLGWRDRLTNSHENEESRADEEKRHEDFGNWLEDQELPPELRLQVEGGK